MGRDRFRRTAVDYAPKPDLSDGEVRLQVDRVGLSANNVTTPSSAVAVLAVLPARPPQRCGPCASSAGVREILCGCATPDDRSAARSCCAFRELTSQGPITAL